VAFEEEEAAVWPINFFPDEAVNHASRELLDEHRLRYSAEKIMLQVIKSINSSFNQNPIPLHQLSMNINETYSTLAKFMKKMFTSY